MRWLVISLVIAGFGVLGLSVMGSGVTGVSQDGFVSITPERALRQDIRSSTSSSQIEKEIDKALSKGDTADALMYRDIAAFARLPLRVETIKRLSNVKVAVSGPRIDTNITQQTDKIHRILAVEGSKLIAGESFDQFALGLTVANLTAQSQGDAAVTPKAGIELIRTAHRSGKLTPDFSAYVARLIQDAVNFTDLQSALLSTRIADRTETLSTLKGHVADIESTQLIALSETLDALSDRVGQHHTIKLLGYIRTPEDLDALLVMSNVLQDKTYGIVKLTGRTSLENLQTEIALRDFVSRNALAILIWISGLVIALVGRQIFRSRWKRLTLDDDPQPERIDPSLPPIVKIPDIKKARV